MRMHVCMCAGKHIHTHTQIRGQASMYVCAHGTRMYLFLVRRDVREIFAHL